MIDLDKLTDALDEYGKAEMIAAHDLAGVVEREAVQSARLELGRLIGALLSELKAARAVCDAVRSHYWYVIDNNLRDALAAYDRATQQEQGE